MLQSLNIWEQIKGKLNSGNACHYSVYSLLASLLLFKNAKIEIYTRGMQPFHSVGHTRKYEA
jgi:L-rhamnose mutarotase